MISVHGLFLLALAIPVSVFLISRSAAVFRMIGESLAEFRKSDRTTDDDQ